MSVLNRTIISCLLVVLGASCVREGVETNIEGQDIRLTILHTTDMHSRMLPYDMDVLMTDRNLGLNQANAPFGGVARLAYLVKEERARSARTLLVDSGDPFQGAPIFNIYEGEVEMRAMSLLRYDAMVLGNHEFDNGVRNLTQQIANWSTFPILAANYYYRTPPNPEDKSLGDYTRPYTIINRDGLLVGIIGIANLDSLSSLGYGDNSLNITPYQYVETVQHYINVLQPHVHLIIATSHAGLHEDHYIIENTVGLDVLMGGHLHIVLDPPHIVYDAADRPVILCHSGAFLKYLGRLDLVLRGRPDDPRDFEVLSHRYRAIPVDSTVPEDPEMLRLLEPYARGLREEIDLTSVLAYAPRRLLRFGPSGGDSPLGNFVVDAMRKRRRVETDFAINNSLGIRTDIVEGPILLDQTFNVFPFPNTISTMTLSGTEIQEMLNFNAERSAGRGCATQLQGSGISWVNDCSVSPALARDIMVGGAPIQPNFFYTMATNNYLAGGGSGFRVLRFNATQHDTGITIRSAVNDAFMSQPSCAQLCQELGESLDQCEILRNCREDIGGLNGRLCLGYDPYSDQERCIDRLAPACLELSDRSDWETCRTTGNRACEGYYHLADRERCYLEQEPHCEGYERNSPRVACAIALGAGDCANQSSISRYDACHERALRDAEATCIVIACVEAEADGRIQRILPTNEYVPVEETPDYDDAAALMEAIQTELGDEESGW